MSLFKSSLEYKMDDIILRLEMNMSNNYKDAAQLNLKELEEAVAEAESSGEIRPKKLLPYQRKLSEFQSRMQGFTHKDQKPYWT